MDVAVTREPSGEYELDMAGRGAEVPYISDVRDFVTANWAQLYRMAYFMTGNQQDAEDTAQTAMAVVVERWSRIQRHDAPIIYARRVVATTIYRRTRRRRMELQRLSVVGRGSGTSTADASYALVMRDELLAALAQLSPRMRAAVVMRHYGDMSERETAAALGCSLGTVKSQTSKGLAKLRRLMTPVPEERT